MAAWRVLRRTRFAEVWRLPPALTVLAATPGWGRTTWMTECAAVSADHARVVWLTSRRAVEEFCAAVDDEAVDEVDDESVDEDVVALIDDVIFVADDPLWALLADRMRRCARTRVVVSTIDLPPRPLLEGLDMLLIGERELALTPDETVALAALNDATVLPDVIETIVSELAGAPVLARRRLESLRARSADALWNPPGAPLELSRLADFAAFPVALREQTVLGRILKQAVSFRRFSVELMAIALDMDLGELAAEFARLRTSSLGDTVADGLTGQEYFEWTAATWSALQAARTPDERDRDLRRARDVSERAGQPTMQLFYLLALGDHAGAERLVYENFRLFLLSTPTVTYRALVEACAAGEASRYPNLLVLAAELRNRHAGGNAESDPWFRRGLTLLHTDATPTAFDRLRVVCRQLLAVISLGDREGARRRLRTVMELLGEDGHRGLAAHADEQPQIWQRLGAELYVPFWAATQLDDHALAMQLTQLMRRYASDTSPTAIAEELTAQTEENFAGMHSRRFDDRSEPTSLSHSDAFVLLEEGRDADALQMVQSVAARAVGATPPKSTAEAFVLIVRALLVPRTLSAADIDDAVQRSARFFTDGVPSTFVTLAAVVAHLVSGGPQSAVRLVEAHPVRDWFTLVAEALVALAGDDAPAAMQALDAARALCGQPRAAAVVDVLTVVAHTRLGRDDAAAALLETTWQTSSERLLRFALRFVAGDDFDVIASLEPLLTAPLSAAIESAREDPRPLQGGAMPRPTPAELEILSLLREGLSTPQIAHERVVSKNTVRTQLRMLFRKLNVSTRAEAVARAEELGLLARR